MGSLLLASSLQTLHCTVLVDPPSDGTAHPGGHTALTDAISFPHQDAAHLQIPRCPLRQGHFLVTFWQRHFLVTFWQRHFLVTFWQRHFWVTFWHRYFLVTFWQGHFWADFLAETLFGDFLVETLLGDSQAPVTMFKLLQAVRPNPLYSP